MVQKPQKSLNMLNVALMFVGAIMGAGFASGREIWQFFGLFGKSGLVGVALVAGLFVVLGVMTAYIARTLGTAEMGRIIVPGNNPRMVNLISGFMAFILFTVLINMTAAGGALFNQVFGINSLAGGILIAVLVVITVLGDFERISHVFRYIMPVLFVAVVGVSLMVIFSELEMTPVTEKIEPSPIAANWALAACLYISYNILAMIPIAATSSVRAKSTTTAVAGSALGGVFLGVLAFVIVSALQKDPAYAQVQDMPMLAYSMRISRITGLAYTVLLFAAIYSSATSNFYGYTTKIKSGPHKKKIIIISAGLAFLLGLAGFKNIVAYMFPIEGYLGFVIMAMISVNFFKVLSENRKKSKTCGAIKSDDIGFKNFEGHDRLAFPEPLLRVTGGAGGEAILILGSEKTALYDCGMACFSDVLIRNIKKALDDNNRTLDYIFMSHTHYDHIGALPYLIEEWKDVTVCGSRKAREVFASKGALDTMERLGNKAKEQFGCKNINIIADGMRIDRILCDGEAVSLGRESITAYESKGHTDCSMSYLLRTEQHSILFACESVGVVTGPDNMYPSVLKNYEEALSSVEKLKKLSADYILISHYGVLPQSENKIFFEKAENSIKKEYNLIEDGLRRGLSGEEVFEIHKQHYWNEERRLHQPFEAYRLNAEITINLIRKSLIM